MQVAMQSVMVFTAMLFRLSASYGDGDKIPLHFFFMTSKTGHFTASGVIPVVDLALEQINNSTEILGNYSLSYTDILDSKV